MSTRLTSLALGAAVLAAVGFALFSNEPAPTASPPPAAATPPAFNAPGSGETTRPALPPNHPPIGGSPHGGGVPSADEKPAITWKAPAAWQTLPNPNAMRIATYGLPRAKGATEEVTVSVSRAGGTTEANIQRWLGQFDNAGQERRTTKKVRGLTITIVEVSGTYLEGSMSATAPRTRAGWTLLGAIVETSGSPYFFKLVGPAATVLSARAGFDALLASVTPS